MSLPPNNDPTGTYDFAAVVVCTLSKFTKIIPCQKTISSKNFADLLYKKWVLEGPDRIPREIIADRDTRFNTKFWESLMMKWDTKLSRSTADHHNTIGLAEGTVRIAKGHIERATNNYSKQWIGEIPAINFAFNNQINSATTFSPFETIYSSKREHMEKIRNHYEKVVKYRKKGFDKNRPKGELLKIGDKVLLRDVARKGKFSFHWGEQVYIITAVDPELENYTLLMPETSEGRHKTFHIRYLKRFTDPLIPVVKEKYMEEGEERVEVEKVLRWERWVMEDEKEADFYLIKLKDGRHSWEPEINLSCWDLIKKFKKMIKKNKPQKSSINVLVETKPVPYYVHSQLL